MASITLQFENDYWNGYIPKMAEKMNKNHLRHLNKTVVLPITHAAVSHNIKVGGRPKPFAPLSPKYKEYKQNTTPLQFHNQPRTPRWLGRYVIPSTSQSTILIRSRKLWHHLGTIAQALHDKIIYGVANVDYADDLIRGRSSGIQTVNIEAHTRRSYQRSTKSGSTTVRATEVKAHKKRMKVGKMPPRNYLVVTKGEINVMMKAIGEYIMAPAKQKFVVIKSNIPFKANRYVKIITKPGVGKRLTA